MQIEVNPKKYVFSFVDDEHYDEGDNSLSLSEEQFKKLLLQMCNIADDEDLLASILNEVNSAKNQVQKRNRTITPFIG